jgi:hypothetical protein
MSYRQVWLKHVRIDQVIAFPRDFTLHRHKLYSEKQYLTSCEHAHRNRLELYTSVLSDYEVANNLVTTLFYDIDADHLEPSDLKPFRSRSEVKSNSISTSLLNNRINNIGSPGGLSDYYLNLRRVEVVELIVALEPVISKVRSVFSGRRGVHLYVDLNPVRVIDLRGASEYVAEVLGIRDIVDRQVLGDWRRMSRVPGSYHRVTGNECVVLNPSTDPELTRILSELIYEKFVAKSKSFEVPMPREMQETISVQGEPPPCISFLTGQLLSGQNLKHEARIHLGTYLLRLGLKPEEIAVLFRKVPDFNESTTLYQLRWLQKHNYKMYSCMKARQYGLCPLPLETCKYYPSPNWWFR